MNAYQRRKDARQRIFAAANAMAVGRKFNRDYMAEAIKNLPKNLPPGRYIVQSPLVQPNGKVW